MLISHHRRELSHKNEGYGERGARAYNRALGGAPNGVQGQSPWSGVREAKAPEAEIILIILSFRSANKVQIFPFLLSCKLLKYAF